MFKGEKFAVSKPDECTMDVSAKGITARIYVNKTTNRYHVGLDGSATGHDEPSGLLDEACTRILHKAARPTSDDLCKGLDDLYEKLGK